MARLKLKARLRQLRQQGLSKRQKRLLTYVGLGLLAAYLLVTVFTWSWYKHRFFPRTIYSSTARGNSSFNQQTLSQALPATIQLKVADTTLTPTPKDLGITANPQVTLARLRQERRLSPVLAFRLLTKHVYPLGVSVNDNDYKTYITSLSKYQTDPKDAHLEVKGDTVSVVAAADGKTVDSAQLRQTIVKNLARNHSTFTVPFSTKPANTAADLKTKADKLNGALDQAVGINYTGGKYSPTKTEKAGWLSATGTELTFDKTKIASFLIALQGKLGQSWDNQSAVSGQIADKLNAGSGLTVSMHDKPKVVRTYDYCVALKDVPSEARGAFEAKLRSTYADGRGWGLNGKINFVQVNSGCDFTVWLAAANDLPAMGPGVCDNYYSCTVSPNVIINYDRWQGATDPWNSAGGSLEDYRVMVINHETGHWLGFGHRNCPGTGQAAPVMQQQSISLQGCTFNPWPAPYELTALAQLKGV